MPAIITHQLFGEEVYEQLAIEIGESPACRESFLLGNHGPDPLFFLRALPMSEWDKKLGGLLHAKLPSKLFQAINDVFICGEGQALEGIGREGVRKSADVANRDDKAGILKAYGLGFVCHYLLDSTVHPLVFAQQAAICDSGFEGLSRKRDWHTVHALIETELDEYVLTMKRGVSVRDYCPHREALVCSKSGLAAISMAYSLVVGKVYGKPCSSMAFANAVSVYRAAQTLLDSRRSAVGPHLNRVLSPHGRYPFIQAMTHDGRLRHACPFCNDDAIAWPSAHVKGVFITESFDQLYQKAFSRALQWVPRFASGLVTVDDCRLFTRNINFSGVPNAVHSA